MKAILEFNLPEEETEHLTAVKAGDWKFALHDLDSHLRHKLKHDDNLSEETIKVYEEVRELICEFLEDRGLQFE